MIHNHAHERVNYAATMSNNNEYIIRAYDSHEAAQQATNLANLMDEELTDVCKL